MILIENNSKNQSCFCIPAFLMYENIIVEKILIKIYRAGLIITPVEILTEKLVPYAIQNHAMNLLEWLISRGLTMITHRNIYFTELSLTMENRDPGVPFILSLSNNAVSLSDKYWVNTSETTEFTINGAQISFKRKTWSEADPFKNLHKPGPLEEYALNDIFMKGHLSGIPAKSLIWSTSGGQNKRWMLDDKGYYLEKKLMKEDFDNEVQTFEFFEKTSIVTPEYECWTKVLSEQNEDDFNSFSLDSLSEGLYVIKKRCLTNSDSYMVRLYDYMNYSQNLEQTIRDMCYHNNLPALQTEAFIDLIKKYQQQFDVLDYLMNTKNMGLLIDKDEVKPVVWGRLKLKLNLFNQIGE